MAGRSRSDRLKRLVLEIGVICVGVGVGCGAPIASRTPSAEPSPSIRPTTAAATDAPTPSAWLPSSALPVDPAIDPISRSSPSAEAEAAMEACNVAGIGIDAISGMGLLDAATHARTYAPLTGREPELMNDSPAWMIQFKGEVPMPLHQYEVWIDPICIVIDGASHWYATGPVAGPHGTVPPLPVDDAPTLSLPPLTT